MGVQIPVEVLQLDQSWQGAFGSGFDLAVVFAERRRDPGHVQGCVDLLLSGGSDDPGVVVRGQPVLGELETTPLRDPPEVDVVGLVPREVGERCSPYLWHHHPQVDVHALGRDRNGLCASACPHLGDERQGGEPVHDRLRVGRRHEQVDVPDRLAHAPKRTGVCGLGDGGKRAKLVHQLLGDLEGHAELHAGAGLLGLGDGPAQVLLAGGTPAVQPAESLLVERVEKLGQ